LKKTQLHELIRKSKKTYPFSFWFVASSPSFSTSSAKHAF